jgi:predicted TIM-barrel fold metal-dependent hydrolase
VHFYDVERPGGVPWPPPDNKLLYRTVQPEHLTVLAGSLGLAGCIAVECSPILEDNAKLLKLATENSTAIRGVVGGGIEIGSKTFAEDVDKFAEHPKFVGIRARALPFLESLESLEAPKTSYFGDLEHLAVHELSLDLIGPATVRLSSVQTDISHALVPNSSKRVVATHHSSLSAPQRIDLPISCVGLVSDRSHTIVVVICCYCMCRIRARGWVIVGYSLPSRCGSSLKWRSDTPRCT